MTQADLSVLATQYLDTLVQVEQSKDPTALIQFVSPGVYDVRPAIDAPFQRVAVTCNYVLSGQPVVSPEEDAIQEEKSATDVKRKTKRDS